MQKFLTKNYKSIIMAVILFCVLALPMVVGATGNLRTDIDENLTKTGLEDDLGGGSANNLPVLVGNLITAVLGFLGVVFVVLTIYAGFKWMTSNGDPGKVDKAKAMLVQSVIGLIIMLISYGITQFVIDAIMGATA
ncbi:MAG: hypothetical protein WC244_03580 [Patescibacteria group bacterium]